jgi:hypothetical protein
MKKKQLIFKFHNPNTPEETAEIFLAALVAANTEKIEEDILHNIEKEKVHRQRNASALSARI